MQESSDFQLLPPAPSVVYHTCERVTRTRRGRLPRPCSGETGAENPVRTYTIKSLKYEEQFRCAKRSEAVARLAELDREYRPAFGWELSCRIGSRVVNYDSTGAYLYDEAAGRSEPA